MLKLKTILESIFLESPDQVDIPKEHIFLKYNAKTALPFGYYNKTMIIGKPGGIHDFIIDGKRLYRDKLTHVGRIWKDKKIISFWKFPKKNELNKIIVDLNNALLQKEMDTLNKAYNIKVNNSWYIETISDSTMSPTIVSISDYKTPPELYSDWDDWYADKVFKLNDKD